MKTKRKSRVYIISLILVFLITGCGEKEELVTTPSVSLDEMIEAEGEEELDECPEGYVYDYQVSMEPIPEEIAELGGDVCGTIHAYPTEIKIALARLEIEKDMKLKEQNEKNIEGVKQYLEETYNEEFEIEPLSTGIWSYVCTEKSTGKKFVVYMSSLYIMGYLDEVVSVDTYFYEESAQQYNEMIQKILAASISEEYVFRTRIECLEDKDILKLKISIFQDKDIDYISEQQMIIELYDKIKSLFDVSEREICISITLTYFPTIYQEVVEKQYQSSNINNLLYIQDECAEILIEKDEILGQFEYQEMLINKDDDELKKIIDNKDYYSGNEYILPYWKGM